MKIYLVGGAVRDKLLGLTIKDRDWVVTGATSQIMLEKGFLQVGKDFPVFLHPVTKEEYALARTERKTHKGYHGFECTADPEVSLEKDLQRRDLTINAMAEDSNGNLIDPYHGQDDLAQGVLRHVSPAFSEDPVRILRIARFAARFSQQNFHVAHSTNKLMRSMVAEGEVNSLVAERCWAETQKALNETDPLRYFQVLRGCGALAIIFPEFDGLYTKPTNTTSHTTDYPQPKIFSVFARAQKVDDPHYQVPITRFAILMMGVYFKHSTLDVITDFCKRLRVPNDYQELATTTAKMYLTLSPLTILDAPGAFGLIEKCDGLRKPERFNSALIICRIFTELQHTISVMEKLPTLLAQCLKITASSIDIEGLQGKEIGIAIRQARLELVKNKLK